MTELDREHNHIQLAKPQRITEQHWPGDTIPHVSIICLTYNHVTFIHDAIESFLIQETTFPIEILIHDDASTDGTAEIVREYQAHYPQLIKAICQSENQYSQGRKLVDLVWPFIRGSFISICEGDDYWTDAKKLEKQIDLLRLNEEYNFCFHKASLKDFNSKENVFTVGDYTHKNNKVDFQEILVRSSGIIPTSSYVIRAGSFVKIKDFINSHPYLMYGDMIIQHLGSYDIGALYIDEFMSVYRYRTPNSWTEKHSSNHQFRSAVHISTIKYFLTLKNYFDQKYDRVLNGLIFDQLFRMMIHIKSSDLNLYNLFMGAFKSLLESSLKNFNYKKTSLIIYSSGTATEWVLDNLDNLKVDIIIDDEIHKDKTTLRGIRIYHPNGLPTKAFDKKYILITLWDKADVISDRLTKNLGLDKDYIIKIDIGAVDVNRLVGHLSPLI